MLSVLPERRPVSAPLNILQVAHKFPPLMGGIETHVREVSRRMAALGHRVTVLTTDPVGGLPPQEVNDGVHVVRVPAARYSGDALFAPAIYSTLRSLPCDVVHVQGFHTFVPPFAMTAALRAGLPYVVTFHSGGHSSGLRHAGRRLQRLALRPLLRRAAQLVAVSEFEAALFARDLGVPVSEIRVISNGAQISRPVSATAPDPHRPLIVSTGRLERYKGHQAAIDAFAAFRQSFPQARMRIVGEGPFRPMLEAQRDRLGLRDCIEIGGIPPTQREAMADLLGSASLVLMLSEYEAHPVAALEAIALGRHVLALDATGFSEMIARGEVAGVKPGTPPEGIADLMARLVREPATAQAQIPTWDDCTDHLLALYREVLEKRTTSPAAPSVAPRGQ